MEYKKRTLTKTLEKTIGERPLVYLNGPRQVGKSTLAGKISSGKKHHYITFDAPLLLAAAKNDPANFVNTLPEDCLNIIDEVQMAPEIIPYLKIRIDERRKAGEKSALYLLTGSANLMALPELAGALVGRMSILTLYPFSASEVAQGKKNIIASFFEAEFRQKTGGDTFNLPDIIKRATYPELAVESGIDKVRWLDDYLTTILQRDVRTLADIRNPEKIAMLLSVLSMRAGGLLNNAAVSSEIGLDAKTYEKYKSVAINTFLIFEVKPWSTPHKLNKRFTKAVKLYFTDCNLLTYIMKRDLHDIRENDKMTFGRILENFVATELIKNLSATPEITLSYFRTAAGKEVDFVLEKTTGEMIGIEVKSSATLDEKDIAGLLELRNIAGNRLKKGIILYPGKEIFSPAKNIWAVPISEIWQ